MTCDSSAWRKVKLSDVANYSDEKIPTVLLNRENYVSTENMLPNKGGVQTAASLPTTESSIRYCFGQTLVSNIRPYFKKIWLADKDGGCSNDVLSFRVNSLIDNVFLYYLLSQDLFFDYVMKGATGTKMPRGNKKHILDFSFELPPRNVQEKIVAVLKGFDEKIAKNKAINDNLMEQAQLFFNHFFIEFVEFPKNWKEGCLLDISEYLNGLAMQKFPPKNANSSLPVLKIRELRQGMCDVNSDLCSSDIESKYLIYDGNIIFSWSGSLLVDIWCGGKCGLNQHLFKVIPKKYEPWFSFFWTLHHLNRFIAIAKDKATTMGHIKREELANAQIVIPSEDDYTKFNSVLKPMFDSIVKRRIENQRLAELRDTLLPRLMSGELDVSEVEL